VEQIDETNEWVYRPLNNGVYRCGFSTTQAAYGRASVDVQAGLQRSEQVISRPNYFCDDQLTEADI
jgi:putative glutathione S-transferase